MASIIYMTDFSEAYARGILLGISKYACDVGQAWSICRLPVSFRDQLGIEEIISYALSHKVDAVIGQFNSTDKVELFAENGLIALAQDFKSQFGSIPNISGEYYKSGAMAAVYFIDKGFKNFAFYGVKNVNWSENRLLGFSNTLKTKFQGAGYTLSSLELPKAHMWNYDLEETQTWLSELPKPVAILACDDNHAYYIAEACRIMSLKGGNMKLRIPQDIALVGVDNDETICNLSSVKLSSINQDVRKAGYEAARYIDAALKDPSAPKRDIIVPATHIVTRQSSDILVNEDPHIAKVLRYIHENISDKINVDEIVEQVPMSRRLLEDRFKKSMGTSVYNYIIRIRVERIARLISEGMNISDAAFEMGFSDVKNLSRLFRKITGMSPSEYKNRL